MEKYWQTCVEYNRRGLMKNYTKKEFDADGDVRYYNNKKYLHRLDGPAVIWANGDKHWFINGKRHRLDGPAVIWQSTEPSYLFNKEWWINGNVYRKPLHNKLTLFYMLEPQRIVLRPTEE
jgi:hypothetical protein